LEVAERAKVEEEKEQIGERLLLSTSSLRVNYDHSTLFHYSSEPRLAPLDSPPFPPPSPLHFPPLIAQLPPTLSPESTNDSCGLLRASSKDGAGRSRSNLPVCPLNSVFLDEETMKVALHDEQQL